MTEYTPTTEEIRNRILLGADMNDLSEEEREELAEFERWLAEYTRVKQAEVPPVLTVEMIAECIADVSRPFVTGEWASGNFQTRIARAVLALIRGGGEQ